MWAAVEFARFVRWSGLVKLFEENAQGEPLKVDGAYIRWKAEELERCCTERFRTNSTEPTLTAAYLQSLHDKIDLMAGYLGKLTVGSVNNGESDEQHSNEQTPLRDSGRARAGLADRL